MRKLKLWSLVLFAVPLASAFADKPTCVRNYAGTDGKYACDVYSNSYTWVYPADAAIKKVCTRIYSPVMCDTAPKEYNEVEALDGTTICILNHNQPPVSNLCDSLPRFYNYILDESP